MKAFLLSFLLLLTIATQAQTNVPSYVPTNGLVGWWPFNGNANDESGNGNNGTVNGATLTSDRLGNTGKAYSFNGISDYISLVQPFFQGSTNVSAFTYHVVIKINQLPNGNSAYAISNKEGYWRSLGMFVSDVGAISFGGSQPYSYIGVGTNPNSIISNQWTCITLTYENSILKLYLNGLLSATSSIPYSTLDFSWPALGNSTSTNLIGACYPVSPGLCNFFAGVIDDFGTWNRALTPAEIQALYLSEQPCPTIANIYGLSNVNAGSTITLTDSTANGTWSSSNTAVATIDASGVLTGISAGTTTISYIANMPCGPDTATYIVTVNSLCLPGYVPTNGLVGWWPFSGNANDESGNGNNGVNNGATLTSDRNGNSNKAFSFDGIDDYVQTPISSTNNYAISIWLNPNLITQMHIIGNDDEASSGKVLVLNTYGGVEIYNCHPTPLPNCYGVPGINVLQNLINANVWTHLVASVNNGNVSFYVNGILAGNGSGVESFGINWQIGAKGNLFTQIPFNGKLDDIGIWNRALTQQEITNLYNAQNPCANFVSNFFTQDTLAVCGTSTTLNAPANYSYTWSNGANTQTITATQTGWYKCTVTNATGCSATDSIYVSLVNANIQQNDTTICAGSTVQLSVGNAASNTSLPTNLQNGLVGYWPFNGNANDESGNGNNGIVYGAALTNGISGTPSAAYLFNSSLNNYIGLTQPFLGGGQVSTFTIHTRIKANSISNSPNIWGKTLFWGEINLLISNDGAVAMFWANNITGNKYSNIYTNPGIIQPGQWYDIVVVYANSTGTIFINGNAVPTNLQWGAQGGGTLSTSQIEATCNFAQDAGSSRFGVRNTGGSWGNYFDGTIDEFNIWSRALTFTEINSLSSFNSGYLFLWSNGATTASINVTPTQTTTYYCTVSNGISSCTDSVTIHVNNPTVNAGNDQSVCVGNSVVLTAATSGQGTLSWSNNVVNGQSFVPVATNNYVATVSDALGCTKKDTVTVTVNPNPTATLTANNITICPNGSTTLTASGGATYLWSNGDTSSTTTVNQAGNYYVIATNAFGCSDTSNMVSISQKAMPTTVKIKYDGPSIVCEPATVNYQLDMPLGSTSGFAYQWYLNGSEVIGATDSVYGASASGNYSLLVSGGSTCNKLSLPKTAVIKPSPTASFTTLGNTTICVGDLVGMVAPVIPGYTYTWMKDGVALGGGTTKSFKLAGTYSVIAKLNGCLDTSDNSVQVVVNPLPIATIYNINNANLCMGDSCKLGAMPIDAANYEWRKGNIISSTTTTPTYKVGEAATYKVIVTDSNGCKSKLSTLGVKVKVTANPVAVINATSSTTIPINGTVKLKASPSMGEFYQWYMNGNPILGGNNQFYIASQSGNYSVLIIKNGCSNLSSSISVTQTGVKAITAMTSTDEFELSAYPNPVEGILTIAIKGVEQVAATIQVMDFSGRLVTMKEMTTTSTTVDMTGYASGVYLIRYKDAEGRTGTIKITKE